MSDKPKSKLRWRLLRWGLISLTVLVTLVALLVTEENWRLKHAWENFKRDAEARGEHFDLASMLPPTVPDDQNFFYAPIVANALDWGRKHKNSDGTPAETAANPMNFNIWPGASESWPTNGGNWQKGKFTDLVEWQHFFRNYADTPEGKTNIYPVSAQPQTPAADVLLALSRYDQALGELRSASLRPYARIPLDYSNDFEATGDLFPWLANMKHSAQFLQLRSLAELENNQDTQALEDIKLLFQVTDCVREQPFLISHLVRIAMMSIALQPIYEGLARHSWSNAQLTELEQLLAKQDYLADFQFAMRGERMFAIDTQEKQRITREMKFVDNRSGSDKVMTVSLRWAPSAFFYGTELAFAQMHQQLILPLVDLTNRIVAPAALRQAEAANQAQMKHYSYYKIQAQLAFPAIASSITKFARTQTQLDLAHVACALERYRITHDNYPETLDDLTPQYSPELPHDIINGQPLHYRRTDDGKYILYSVGWNEIDDGGQMALTKNGSIDPKKGDWVWPSPK